ncbi:MAG: pyridoxamine 5'-phosphate oxidase family protein [Anaerolineales bacterium]|nr:pyridoxamine 5'-phosphate oxidase family protein [Anaerolineales bacterium]
MTKIETVAQLRQLYRAPSDVVLRKELAQLDEHCRRFLALSPLAVLATSGADGRHDASPRGGGKGFIQVLDDQTLLIPDRPGNNRLDTLTNVIETGRIALIHFIPGVNEELRINGRAELHTDDSLRERCVEGGKLPALVIVVTVEEAYLHCPKALLRAELWTAEAQIKRDQLPSLGQMIKDQVGLAGEPEPQAAMEARYRQELY